MFGVRSFVRIIRGYHHQKARDGFCFICTESKNFLSSWLTERTMFHCFELMTDREKKMFWVHDWQRERSWLTEREKCSEFMTDRGRKTFWVHDRQRERNVLSSWLTEREKNVLSSWLTKREKNVLSSWLTEIARILLRVGSGFVGSNLDGWSMVCLFSVNHS